MDIEQLVARGVQGDEAALGSLYRAYHQRMTVICQRIVGDRQVAEDLAHDAFLLAFAKMNQLRNPRRFEQWLTSITTNVALRYKERHHEPQLLPLDALADTDITQENTTTEERPLPTMAELMAAVDALPNGYGQVFRWALFLQQGCHVKRQISNVTFYFIVSGMKYCRSGCVFPKLILAFRQ